MRKTLLPLVAISCLVSSCDFNRPDDYFGRAILNLNFFKDFAGPRMDGEMRQPSMKLVKVGGSEVVQMTRKEVVDDKIAFAESSYEKIKKLKESDDTRAMLEASKAIYDYIIPVYQNEYQELAKLYDQKAPQAEIDALSQQIREKYADGFQTRMAAATTAGKAYAEKHGLKVQWDVGGGPQ